MTRKMLGFVLIAALVASVPAQAATFTGGFVFVGSQVSKKLYSNPGRICWGTLYPNGFCETKLTIVGDYVEDALAQTGVPEGAIGQAPAPPAVGTAQQTKTLGLELTPEQKAKLDAPTLTIEQKQAILLVAKEITLQQQAAQLAMNAAEKAQAQLQQLIAQATPAGYRLTEQLTLEKIPEPKKEPGTQ